MATINKIDLAKYDMSKYEDLIKATLCALNPSRFTIKNVLEDETALDLSFFDILERILFRESGYIVNYYIHGAGRIQSNYSISDIDKDDFNGYYTAIYYPAKDKLIAVKHSEELI